MTFKFYCRHCGQHIEADDFMAGTMAQCPTCLQTILVMPEVVTSTVVLRQVAVPASPPEKTEKKEKDASSPVKEKATAPDRKGESVSFSWGKWIAIAFLVLNFLWFLAWIWPVRWEYEAVPLFYTGGVSSLQEQCNLLSRTLNAENGSRELIGQLPGERNSGNETGESAAILLFRTKRLW